MAQRKCNVCRLMNMIPHYNIEKNIEYDKMKMRIDIFCTFTVSFLVWNTFSFCNQRAEKLSTLPNFF